MRKQNRRLENQRVCPNYLTTYTCMSSNNSDTPLSDDIAFSYYL